MRKNIIFASMALIILSLNGAASAQSSYDSTQRQTSESRSSAATERTGNAQKSLTPSDEVGDHTSSYDSKHGYDSDDAH